LVDGSIAGLDLGPELEIVRDPQLVSIAGMATPSIV
jgi:hypothetical protein